MAKKIIVIKIGTSVLLTNEGKISMVFVKNFVEKIHRMSQQTAFVIVCSGAVALGLRHLKIYSDTVQTRQAAAGVGQIWLMTVLLQAFIKKGVDLAQVLVTPSDFKNGHKEDLKRVFEYYVENRIIPVVNENDVVGLNCFGGNDFLAARVAQLIHADKVLIISTMEGSSFGIGGGQTKVEAVRQLKENNIQAVILNGNI